LFVNKFDETQVEKSVFKRDKLKEKNVNKKFILIGLILIN